MIWLKLFHLQLCEVALRQQILGKKSSKPFHLSGAQLILVPQLRQVQPQRLLHHLLLLHHHHLLRLCAGLAQLPAWLQLSSSLPALGAVTSKGTQKLGLFAKNSSRDISPQDLRWRLAIGNWHGSVVGRVRVKRREKTGGRQLWALTGVRGVTTLLSRAIVCKLFNFQRNCRKL